MENIVANIQLFVILFCSIYVNSGKEWFMSALIDDYNDSFFLSIDFIDESDLIGMV